jgi:hypothetical protein
MALSCVFGPPPSAYYVAALTIKDICQTSCHRLDVVSPHCLSTCAKEDAVLLFSLYLDGEVYTSLYLPETRYSESPQLGFRTLM